MQGRCLARLGPGARRDALFWAAHSLAGVALLRSAARRGTVTRRGSRRDCPARSSNAHLAFPIGASKAGAAHAADRASASASHGVTHLELSQDTRHAAMCGLVRRRTPVGSRDRSVQPGIHSPRDRRGRTTGVLLSRCPRSSREPSRCGSGGACSLRATACSPSLTVTELLVVQGSPAAG
jgi:hypothetical protein